MKKYILILLLIIAITIIALIVWNIPEPKSPKPSINPTPTTVPIKDKVQLPILPSPTKTPPADIPTGIKVYYFNNGQNEIFYDPQYVSEDEVKEEAKNLEIDPHKYSD